MFTRNVDNLRRSTLIMLTFWSVLSAQACGFAGGTGDPDNPYKIATAEQLISIGSDPNLLDKCFVLVNDIDLDPNLPGGRVFTHSVIAPDTGDTDEYQGMSFTGSFYGGRYTIRNLTIRPTTGKYMGYYMGLFGRIGVGGWVKDLGVENTTISNARYVVGGLAAVNWGTIIHCHVAGTIRMANDGYMWYLGGLTGFNDGRIYESQASVNIYGNEIADGVGGLVGTNFLGSVITCKADGQVFGRDHLGGLVAVNLEGTISNCYASGTVSSDVGGALHMGGLVGHNQGGVIVNCYAAGALSNGDDRWDWGGLVGRNSSCPPGRGTMYVPGVIANCFWDTDISGVHISAGGTGMPTSQMQDIETFRAVGWDFDNIWTMSDGKGYPRLRWENEQVVKSDADD